MEFEFTAISKILLEHHKENSNSQLKETSLLLEIGEGLDNKAYFKEDELPNAAGYKALTIALIAGITANIKSAHHTGDWNEVDHVKYVIHKISRAFAHNAIVGKGMM